MKKTLSFLLALFMLLSLFAACGEKPASPADAADNGETAEAPLNADDAAEDEDKEAVEVPDKPVAIDVGSLPSNESPAQPAGQTSPQPAAEAPSSAAPSSQTPDAQAPSAQTPEPQAPAAETKPSSQINRMESYPSDNRGYILTGNPSLDKEYKMLVWGDSVLTAHSPLDIFYSFCLTDGTEPDIYPYTYENLGSSSAYTTLTTFNLFEMFSFTDKSANAQATGPVNSFKYFYGLLSQRQDCLIIATSRDRVIGNSDSAGRAVTAFNEIQKAFYAANPKGKIVLLVPMPYDKPSKELKEKFGFPTDTDNAKHNSMIKTHASALAAKATGECVQAQIGDAFAFFKKNYADSGIDLYDEGGVFESMAGAYYISCLLYSYVFGKSPAGMPEQGFLDADTAALLQKAAHSFVFGAEPSTVAQKSAPKHKSYKECDPRTMTYRDPRFKDEIYPEYFDEFFATAYTYEAFGGAALQYDQNNIASASGSPRRLTLGVDPKTLTPQRMTFLDCTWFCHSVYKAAFDYIIKETVGTGVINIKKGEVYRRTAAQIKADPEGAKEAFLNTIRPGDLIMEHNRENNNAHGMLYIGNGMLIHCSGYSHKAGGGQDYSKGLKQDVRELLGGVAYTPIDWLIKEGVDKHYAFNGERELLLLRPLGVSGTKPTSDAVSRAKNLKGVICWKESTAYAGASVNPGDDVTFTYCVRNDNDTEKTVAFKDALPANTTFKSGDVTFTNGALDASFKIPANSALRLSFTVTVNPDAPYGYIPCADTSIGGVTLQDTPIYVAKTLSADEQKKISSSAVTATTENKLITALYAEAGKQVNLGYDAELISSVCKVATDQKTFDAGAGKGREMLADNLFGGRYYGGDFGGNRIKEVTLSNFTVGDVLCVMKDASTLKRYIYVGNGVFKTVTDDGKTAALSPASSATLLDSLLGEFGFFVLRPSLSF
ncbi:MAG: C40 family peptidase [Clostridia bacterium]|nr:C40 family peptidase [Clostridia bacterium]